MDPDLYWSLKHHFECKIQVCTNGLKPNLRIDPELEKLARKCIKFGSLEDGEYVELNYDELISLECSSKIVTYTPGDNALNNAVDKALSSKNYERELKKGPDSFGCCQPDIGVRGVKTIYCFFNLWSEPRVRNSSDWQCPKDKKV
ncbi:unnamed protein product [Cylicocyclus nassatus]|uniref:Uncharacterized protein n=1 Tax=Cylicocyclus nassatus TaxID=53992 RepID=A0AA36GEL5_CYLNA|nr:unnamed protein product [Cylicocyclus nassatus]